LNIVERIPGLVRGEIEGLVPVQSIRKQLVRFVANSKVESQSAPDPPGIAEVPPGLGSAPLFEFAAVLREKGESAQQKIGTVETALVAETRDVAVELETGPSYGTAYCC
jgi:hypothetical protein